MVNMYTDKKPSLKYCYSSHVMYEGSITATYVPRNVQQNLTEKHG